MLLLLLLPPLSKLSLLAFASAPTPGGEVAWGVEDDHGEVAQWESRHPTYGMGMAAQSSTGQDVGQPCPRLIKMFAFLALVLQQQQAAHRQSQKELPAGGEGRGCGVTKLIVPAWETWLHFDAAPCQAHWLVRADG